MSQSQNLQKNNQDQQDQQDHALHQEVVSLLKGSERWIYQLQEKLNRNPNPQSLTMRVTSLVGEPFVRLITKKRWKIRHIERIENLKSDAGILVISNHRSFFDMFYLMTMLRTKCPHIGNPCNFAVRAPFFYDNPLGFLINFLMAGSSMWPPIFRDERKHRLNPLMLKIVSRLIGEKKVTFGLHPEGARQKNMSPFELAAPRKGIGQILLDCPENVVIIPVFLYGLTNSLTHELKMAFKKIEKDEDFVHFYVGEPLLAKDFQDLSAEDISLKIMSEVQKLATEAKIHDDQQKSSIS